MQFRHGGFCDPFGLLLGRGGGFSFWLSGCILGVGLCVSGCPSVLPRDEPAVPSLVYNPSAWPLAWSMDGNTFPRFLNAVLAALLSTASELCKAALSASARREESISLTSLVFHRPALAAIGLLWQPRASTACEFVSIARFLVWSWGTLSCTDGLPRPTYITYKLLRSSYFALRVTCLLGRGSGRLEGIEILIRLLRTLRTFE